MNSHLNIMFLIIILWSFEIILVVEKGELKVFIQTIFFSGIIDDLKQKKPETKLWQKGLSVNFILQCQNL